MKEQESFILSSPLCNRPHLQSHQKLCSTMQKATDEFEQKRLRFSNYIIARTIDSDAAMAAAGAAIAAGISDQLMCMHETSKATNCYFLTDETAIINCLEPPQYGPGPCRRVGVCAIRELPY